MRNAVTKIIFAWTVLSFLLDLFAALLGENVALVAIIGLVVVHTLICWVAWQMVIGKKWALIALTVYYGLRSINIYTEAVSVYVKSGLNFELSIGDTIGVNLFTAIIFILLIREMSRAQKPAVASETEAQ